MDGTFELAGLTDDGHSAMHVRASDYATATVNISGPLTKPAEFTLVRGGEVRGRCIDASGAPVATAYVAVGTSFMESPWMQHTDLIRATVGDDGRFRAAGLRPDQLYWIYVRSARHGTRVYALSRKLAAGELIEFGDVVLRPSGGIEGHVVDEHGEPQPGISVSIHGANADSAKATGGGEAANAVSQFTSRSATTDANGAFRAAEFSAGTYELSATIRGRRRATSTNVQVVDGAITEGVQLVVPRGIDIAGTLRCSDGHPLGDQVGELVLFATTTSGIRATTRVEPGGRFKFTGLTAERHTIGCTQPPKGWVLAPRSGIAAGTQGLDLVLQPAAIVQGRVLDADGKPVKVHVWARQEGDRSGAALVWTDDEGRFEIEVPADFSGSIGAMHPTLNLLRATRDGVSAGQRDVELKLSRL